MFGKRKKNKDVRKVMEQLEEEVKSLTQEQKTVLKDKFYRTLCDNLNKDVDVSSGSGKVSKELAEDLIDLIRISDIMPPEAGTAVFMLFCQTNKLLGVKKKDLLTLVEGLYTDEK